MLKKASFYFCFIKFSLYFRYAKTKLLYFHKKKLSQWQTTHKGLLIRSNQSISQILNALTGFSLGKKALFIQDAN